MKAQPSTRHEAYGTQCATTCATGDTQLCVTKAACKAGTICAGQTITNRDVCANSEVR